jgi:hypothetical protein
VKDIDTRESKRLSESLYSLQVQNELLHHENEGLRAAHTINRKRGVKRKVLDLQQLEEYHRGAVFCSPKKVREARWRETVNNKKTSSKNNRKQR